MKRIGILSIAVVTAVTLGCSDRKDVAANNPAGDTAAVGTAGKADANKVTNGDKDFVHDVAIANMAEVELGTLAAERAANAEVKKFAEMMVTDHTAAGDKLKAVASQNGIDWPAQLDDKHRDLREKLAKRQGPDFDRDYIAAMIDGHKDVVDKLESRIDKENLAEWKTQMADRVSGKKAEERGQAIAILPAKSDNAVTASINQWAAETYPVAQAHLEAAKVLDKAVKRRNTTP
jgi:putative membrane protein